MKHASAVVKTLFHIFGGECSKLLTFRGFSTLDARQSLGFRLYSGYRIKCSGRRIQMEKKEQSISRCSNREIHKECDDKSVSRGALIVLEGLDRCGKTSQCGKLVSYLKELGYPAESWRYPDRSTCVGQMISSYLSNESHLDDRAIHLLFSANRWEKRLLMESMLKNGTTLVVDRYSFSGVAFSSAKGLDMEWCKAPDSGLLAPDLVVYLDITPENAAKRGGYGSERYEQLEFQKKVYLSYHALHDATWKVIDATLPFEEVEKQLRPIVLESVKLCKKGLPLSELWIN